MSQDESLAQQLSLDVIVQGPVWDVWTQQVIESWSAKPWVSRIILSTWTGSRYLGKGPEDSTDTLQVIWSDDVGNPGSGNRNRQVVTSRAGLLGCQSEWVVKTRSDQIFYPAALTKMAATFLAERNDTGPQYLDTGIHQVSPIFVGGL